MSLLSSQTAHREYAQRPADERYPSLQALVEFSRNEKNLSAEKTYNLKDLKAVATWNGQPLAGRIDTENVSSLMLESPKGRARFTHWSFGQLSRVIGAPASYLRDLPPTLAADCINFGLHDSSSGTAANLLVRAANGTPEPTIRAATSESYGRVWDADLYQALQDQIVARDDRWTTPPTWTGEPAGVYRGDRDSFVILTNGGSIVTDPSLSSSTNAASPLYNGPRSLSPSGNPPENGMYRGILIRNSEVGASSVTIETILYRYICGNHLLWGAILDKSFRRRHVGSHTLRDTIREISRIAWNFTNASASRDEAIIRSLIDHEIAHTREAVIDELRAMGASKEQATAAYDRCEQTESASPRSFWGAAQGLTRLSQDAPNQDDRYMLDRIAAVVMTRGAKLVRA